MCALRGVARGATLVLRPGFGATLVLLLALGCSDATPGSSVRGVVQSGPSGDQRLAGAEVALYAASEGAPRLLGAATSDASGAFRIEGDPAPGAVRYVIARPADGVVLAAVLGDTPAASVVVDELTTVAAAYAFAQLYADGGFVGKPLALRIAAGMSANLADVATGGSSAVLLSSPNADQTNSLRSTRNLANLVAGCVREPARCAALFELATPPRGAPPADTLAALVNVARHPAHNAAGIWAASRSVEPYQPPLAVQPDAWTIAVKVNRTGSDEMVFGGTANTLFDDRGYAWINNNVVQGTGTSSNFFVVLKPDGSPSDGSDGTPRSPLTGGGLLGNGLGISRSPVDGSIWTSNFGWGGVDPGPGGTGTGSVSRFAPDGTPLSPSDGYDGGTDRVQGVAVDRDGNVWLGSYGNDRLVVLPGGDPARAVWADTPCHPFGVAIASDGTAWLATLGGSVPGDGDQDCEDAATVSHWRFTGDRLEQLSVTAVGAQLKGVDVDFADHVWVGSGGDDTVYRLDPAGNVVGAFRDGGIDAPWAVRVDDAGDVWLSNFGALDPIPPGNVYAGAVSVLAGPGSPSGLPVGAPLSPPTGFTLPSAGEPVLLSDGTPISETGEFGQPAFTPLMRIVSTVPDRAGNLWCSNNWKPNFTSDIAGDPGGDGMVIFVGLAAPTEPGRTQ